jgi:SAM-dependent methyltransferase
MNGPADVGRARALDWTPELVARFWDYSAASEETGALYFTRLFGAEILEFLRDVTDLHGKQVIDYGAGPGYLVQYLLENGAAVTAADYSAASVDAANQRFGGKAGWQGAMLIRDGALAVDDGAFDLITCVETVEHMFDQPRAAMLGEFRRLLKPGGRLFVTVPNEEDLRGSHVYCPQCAHEFHRWQHLTSWDQEKMSRLLHDAGFKVEFCQGVALERWGPSRSGALLDTSLRSLLRDVRDRVATTWASVGDRVVPRAFPDGRLFRWRAGTRGGNHLVAVARA